MELNNPASAVIRIARIHRPWFPYQPLYSEKINAEIQINIRVDGSGPLSTCACDCECELYVRLYSVRSLQQEHVKYSLLQYKAHIIYAYPTRYLWLDSVEVNDFKNEQKKCHKITLNATSYFSIVQQLHMCIFSLNKSQIIFSAEIWTFHELFCFTSCPIFLLNFTLRQFIIWPRRMSSSEITQNSNFDNGSE